MEICKYLKSKQAAKENGFHTIKGKKTYNKLLVGPPSFG